METFTTASAVENVATGNHPLVSIVVIALVIAVTEVLKRLNKSLTERARDVLVPIVASVLMALAMGTGLVEVENLSEVVAYLVAPQGWWIAVKKVLGK